MFLSSTVKSESEAVFKARGVIDIGDLVARVVSIVGRRVDGLIPVGFARKVPVKCILPEK